MTIGETRERFGLLIQPAYGVKVTMNRRNSGAYTTGTKVHFGIVETVVGITWEPTPGSFAEKWAKKAATANLVNKPGSMESLRYPKGWTMEPVVYACGPNCNGNGQFAGAPIADQSVPVTCGRCATK